MTQSTPASATRKPTIATRRFGYLVAILVNAAILFVVNNLLAWDVLPWLTEDFELVLPLMNASILANILANAIYVGYDAAWFKSLTQIGLAALGLAVAIRTFRVFPFDFSDYGFNWTALTRGVLILAMVGISIGIIAESVKLLTALVRRSR